MHAEQGGDERVILDRYRGWDLDVWWSPRKAGVMQDGVGGDDLLGAQGYLQSSPRALEWDVGHRAI